MKKLVLITVILAFAANTFAAGAGIACSGRINKTNSTYKIQYFITDHLGSVRVIINQNGEIKEQKDYYPFGKKHENPNLMTSVNRYQRRNKRTERLLSLWQRTRKPEFNDLYKPLGFQRQGKTSHTDSMNLVTKWALLQQAPKDAKK
ncbi:MAG: hypothetical protein LBP85_10610 [Prevotellaceae bacterium]|jgi:hypothetical protein|nr:hypothetical protein [Prevotellaceae bacterium]